MEVTGVRFRPALGEGRVLASASVEFDHVFVVHDFRVIAGSEGPFVSNPARRLASGQYRDVAHAVTAEWRQILHDAILQAYEAWMSQAALRPARGLRAAEGGSAGAGEE